MRASFAASNGKIRVVPALNECASEESDGTKIRYLDQSTDSRARAARLASHVSFLKSAGYDAAIIRSDRSTEAGTNEVSAMSSAAIAASLDANDLLIVPGEDAACWSEIPGEFSIVVDVSADPDPRPHILPPRCVGVMTDGRGTMADSSTDPEAPTILVAPTLLSNDVFAEPHRTTGSTPRVLVVGSDTFEGHAEMARYELHTRGVACNFVANGERDPDLRKKMRTHDVLVFLSSSSEMPTALMEAMAHGMIVVVFDGGAEGRCVADALNGFKVDLGDWRQAARRAASVRDLDRAKISAIRSAAQTTARTEWGEPARRALIEAVERWAGRGALPATKPMRRTRRATIETSSIHA